MGGDDFAGVESLQFFEHSLFVVYLAWRAGGSGPVGRAEKHLVIKNEGLGFRFGGELGQFLRRGMKAGDVISPILLAPVVTELGVNFVEENIAAIAVLDDALARGAIAGEDDDLIGRLEPVTESFLPGTVMNGERFR